MYKPMEPSLYRWTPRQVKAVDEALRRLCPVARVEEDLPRTDSSQRCGCTVTSSEGTTFIHTWGGPPEDQQEHPAVQLHRLID